MVNLTYVIQQVTIQRLDNQNLLFNQLIHFKKFNQGKILFNHQMLHN